MLDEQILKDTIMNVLFEMRQQEFAAANQTHEDESCATLKCINHAGCGSGNCACCNEIQEITSEEQKSKILVPNPIDEKSYRFMKETTPARIGVWRAGDRPLTETVIRFRADHALAMDSVFSLVDEAYVRNMNWLPLKTRVEDKDQYLTRPDMGRELCVDAEVQLKEKCMKNPQLQIIISDGLSSKAVEANMEDLMPAFVQGLELEGIKYGTPVFVKFGRVGIMDAIGEDLNAEAAIIFIGERPGLMTAESLSAYMLYNPRRGVAESERTVLSNIHRCGTPPPEAGAHLATLVKQMLTEKSSGVVFKG